MCTLPYVFCRAMKDKSGLHVGITVHVSGLAFANSFVLLSNDYREMQDLEEQGTGRVKKAPLVWLCCKTSRR